MFSIEPDDGSGQVDACQEVARGLLIARGDSTKVLQTTEEVLDVMALLVQLFVVGGRILAIAARGITAVLPAAASTAARTRLSVS